MNTENLDQVMGSAYFNRIGVVYTVIKEDPSILENIDKNQFVETPLHIAALMGHLEYAIEIMNLKPSFATKLNLEGYTPIHFAMLHNTDVVRERIPASLLRDNSQMELVSYLVGINKDLVRVKAREGLTPLHLASKLGEVELLAKFLTVCPDSIKDVTVKGESALHIAARMKQYKALEFLLTWLQENCGRGAKKLKWEILNLKDYNGNTALHISALSSEPKSLEYLANTGMSFDGMNSDKKKAIDLASTPEMKKILTSAKEKRLSIMIKVGILDAMTWISRIRSDITEEQRNTWLIIATLVATVTYESTVSPPGGVFQVSASDDNNMKIKSGDMYYSTRGNAGKSILSKTSFMGFSLANMLSFSLSIIAIVIMTPGGVLRPLVLAPVTFFTLCYLIAMPAISPTHTNTIILSIPMYSIFLLAGFMFYFFGDHIIIKKRIISCYKCMRATQSQTCMRATQSQTSETRV
ncbi:ankyrin repeat-containing protein BDA1-like [Vicia villosa]|uniref:ankyrin repeat-containing protein BDA1-like n=1 Tax=Vicia villosa TaxID=3911 RepID=UPI00273ADB61|nr:ankyrin repeat-containing protein BDA1-like [Vicia villosa]